MSLVTTHRGGLNWIWPHTFSSVYANMSWVTLKDHLLNWCALPQVQSNKRKCHSSDATLYHSLVECLATLLPFDSDILRTLQKLILPHWIQNLYQLFLVYLKFSYKCSLVTSSQLRSYTLYHGKTQRSCFQHDVTWSN